jgi:hypothetical protein
VQPKERGFKPGFKEKQGFKELQGMRH